MDSDGSFQRVAGKSQPIHSQQPRRQTPDLASALLATDLVHLPGFHYKMHPNTDCLDPPFSTSMKMTGTIIKSSSQ